MSGNRWNFLKAFSTKRDPNPERPHEQNWVTASDLGGTKFGLDVALGGGESDGSNNSTTPLSSGATFTGTGELNGFPQVGVMVKTDQPGTMYFDFSGDGTNWDSTFPVQGFRVAAGVPEFHTAVKLGRYFRVRFVNDNDGAQTYFRLFTYYGLNFVPSIAPLNQTIGTDTDAINTRPSNFGDEVVIGKRSGVRPFTKFGYRTGLTAAGGEETIWATTGNFTPMTSAETFTITFNNTTDGLGTTGALSLFIDYVDSDGLYVETQVTLDASGSQVTSFSGFGINRVAVVNSGTAETNTNTITITATTSGTTQAVIPAGQGVTQQCIYHTDANSYAVAKFLWVNINKISGGGNPRVVIKGYIYNRTYQTRFEVFRMTIDTSVENTVSLTEPIGFRLSPRDVLEFRADTDTNNTVASLRFSLFEYKIT